MIWPKILTGEDEDTVCSGISLLCPAEAVFAAGCSRHELQLCENLPQFKRQAGNGAKHLVRKIVQPNPPTVQEEPLTRKNWKVFGPIGQVTYQWTTQVGHVNSDLMRSPSDGLHFQQHQLIGWSLLGCVPGEDPVLCPRFTTQTTCLWHHHAIANLICSQRAKNVARGTNTAQGQIFTKANVLLVNQAAGKLPLQPIGSWRTLQAQCYHQNARSWMIQPGHYANASLDTATSSAKSSTKTSVAIPAGLKHATTPWPTWMILLDASHLGFPGKCSAVAHASLQSSFICPRSSRAACGPWHLRRALAADPACKASGIRSFEMMASKVARAAAQALSRSQALISTPNMIGVTSVRLSSFQSTWRHSCQPASSQALKAVVTLNSSGWRLHSDISSSKVSPSCHWLPLWQALSALLKLIWSGSTNAWCIWLNSIKPCCQAWPRTHPLMAVL